MYCIPQPHYLFYNLMLYPVDRPQVYIGAIGMMSSSAGLDSGVGRADLLLVVIVSRGGRLPIVLTVEEGSNHHV